MSEELVSAVLKARGLGCITEDECVEALADRDMAEEIAFALASPFEAAVA